MKELSMDLETFSSVDIAKCGVYRYADAPDFEILLFGYSVDKGPVQVIDLASGEKVPEEILDALTDESVIKWSFNAEFERICLSRFLRDLGRSCNPFVDKHPLTREPAVYLSPEGWHCSKVWSAYMGLPQSLKEVGRVLGLSAQKMDEGKDLIKFFCVPCKATKTNGGRTRNMPTDAPDKWRVFKAYNIRDVEVEMEIKERLHNYPVPDSAWEEYVVSEEINDNGVLVDQELIDHAIELDAISRKDLSDKLRSITGLENPNSVQQLKGWLSENGVDTEDLGKRNVKRLIDETDGQVKEALTLRLSLAKSSVKKYTAMKNAVCSDGRVHGMFVFYGAGRTGRFTSKIVQLQNLPQNHLPDLAEARSLVKAGDFDSVSLLYEDIPDTLSQLIRTAFIPAPGKKFIISDFSAIECRVLAWYAGEQWVLDTFANGGDIYCATAEKMFHVPVKKHGINGELRQKGKQATLSCIAKGQLVPTDHGLKPIEAVALSDRVWDGESWVSHEGVIDKGEREVITYEGLTATPDHLVYVEGQPWPVHFGIAATCRAHLTKTGDGREAVRLGEDHQPGEAMEPEMESLLRADTVYVMRKYSMDGAWEPERRQVKGLPAVLSAKTDSSMARKAPDGSQTALRESKQPGVSELRSSRNPVSVSKRNPGRSLSDRPLRPARSYDGDRPDRQQRELCTRESSLCAKTAEQPKSEDYGAHEIRTEVLAILRERGYEEAVRWIDSFSDHNAGGACSQGKEKELAHHLRKARLYDIRNAGRHHRFTVSGCLVHNCGYGGSVGALKAMGALEAGMTEDELQPLVAAWRQANPHIVKFWWEIDHAAMRTVTLHSTEHVGNLTFTYQSGMMFITLPSGRRLAYVKPKIGTNQFGSDCITYEGIGTTKKWERLETYGPKLVENIVQSTSRDILCYAMKTLRCCRIEMHIHDELIIEADPGMSQEELSKQMSRVPPWAPGLILNADGFESEFYKKD